MRLKINKLKKLVGLFASGLMVFGTVACAFDDREKTLGARWSQIDARPNDEATLDAPWLGRGSFSTVVHNGKMYLMGGVAEIGGESGELKDVWTSTDGTIWAELNRQEETTGAGLWSARASFGLFSLNGNMFLIGGAHFIMEADGTRGLNFLNDVWASSDGMIWRKQDAGEMEGAAPWSARGSFATVMHQNRVFIMGGLVELTATGGGTAVNDVWSSGNGQNWEKVGDASWSARMASAVVSHKDKLFLFGGKSFTNPNLRDVWSSEDGRTWTQVDANGGAEGKNAPWGGRSSHVAFSDGERMYVAGGTAVEGTGANTKISSFNDVWASSDGRTWTQVDADNKSGSKNAPWHSRTDFSVQVHDNRVYLMGGVSSDGKFLSDVWSSVDER